MEFVTGSYGVVNTVMMGYNAFGNNNQLGWTKQANGGFGKLESGSAHSIPQGVSIPHDGQFSKKSAVFSYSNYWIVRLKPEGKSELSPETERIYNLFCCEWTMHPEKRHGGKMEFGGTCNFQIDITRHVGTDGRAHVSAVFTPIGVQSGQRWAETKFSLDCVPIWHSDGTSSGLVITFQATSIGTFLTGRKTGADASSITVWGDGTVEGGVGPVFTGLETTLFDDRPMVPSSVTRQMVANSLKNLEQAAEENAKVEDWLDRWHAKNGPALEERFPISYHSEEYEEVRQELIDNILSYGEVKASDQGVGDFLMRAIRTRYFDSVLDERLSQDHRKQNDEIVRDGIRRNVSDNQILGDIEDLTAEQRQAAKADLFVEGSSTARLGQNRSRASDLSGCRDA